MTQHFKLKSKKVLKLDHFFPSSFQYVEIQFYKIIKNDLRIVHLQTKVNFSSLLTLVIRLEESYFVTILLFFNHLKNSSAIFP